MPNALRFCCAAVYRDLTGVMIAAIHGGRGGGSSKRVLGSGRAAAAGWRAAYPSGRRAPRAAPCSMPATRGCPKTWIRRGNRFEAREAERHALPRSPVRGPVN